MPNLKGGILYSRCPCIETRHLARQEGGASAGFFFIKFIGKFFVKHAAKEEGKQEEKQDNNSSSKYMYYSLNSIKNNEINLSNNDLNRIIEYLDK